MDETKLEIHAKPRAKKSRVIAVGPPVEIALAAPPVDGAANDELVRFLAEVLGLPKRAIAILRGESSRHKLVAVEGVAPAEVGRRLEAAIAR